MYDKKKKTTTTSRTRRPAKISNPSVLPSVEDINVNINVAKHIKTRAQTTMSEQSNVNDSNQPSTSAIPDDTNIANTGVSCILSFFT